MVIACPQCRRPVAVPNPEFCAGCGTQLPRFLTRPPRVVKVWPPSSSQPQLEALIDQAPDDDDRRRVYADFLQAAGDVRGALSVLAGREAKVFAEENAEALFGSLSRSFLWGYPNEVQWRHGFAEAAAVQGESTEHLAERTAAFLALPIARFVRTLRLSIASMGPEHGDDNDDWDWRPTLEAVRQRRGAALTHLELWFGCTTRARGTVAGIEPLLRGDGFPALRHLALANFDGFADLIGAVRTSPLLPRLRSLDLSGSTFDVYELPRFAEATPALAHLARLDLQMNKLNAEAEAAVRAALPTTELVFGRQLANVFTLERRPPRLVTPVPA